MRSQAARSRCTSAVSKRGWRWTHAEGVEAVLAELAGRGVDAGLQADLLAAEELVHAPVSSAQSEDAHHSVICVSPFGDPPKALLYINDPMGFPR